MAKEALRDAQSLRLPANSVAHLQKEIERLKEETKHDEQNLATSGSTRTISDIEEELQQVTEQM
jgi:hypothetical protein